MDYEKAKLRSDVDGLTGLIQSLIVRAEVLEKHTEVGVLAQQVKELQARVETLEKPPAAPAPLPESEPKTKPKKPSEPFFSWNGDKKKPTPVVKPSGAETPAASPTTAA